MIEPSATAKLVMAFANTVDLEDDTDELATPSSATSWLRKHDFTPADHTRLVALRTGIRAALGAGPPDTTGDEVISGLPVRINLHGDVLTPAPETDRTLGRLAIAWATLVLTGESVRLKRCADDKCGWVFWDVSRNHSRRWCSMRVCGNRAKARRYASRRREG